jgi:Predicted integral membrane protein
LLITAGIAVSAVAGYFFWPRNSGKMLEKSIAVLPFDNLSEEKENAYFADGIQDDLLTNLSKIGDLKVISRRSVMEYRGQAQNIREIAKALGVAAVVEGSVRRIGNHVRVNVQLINGAADQHIWAEDYDRDLTDVFAIQSDLAQKIAAELQAKLSPKEKAQVTRKPTENSDAYLAYLQANEQFNRPDRFNENSLKAEQLYEQATRLDPNFALAFAALSNAESWLYHSSDPTPARREKARVAAEEALRLQPDLPEGHLALGNCFYYGQLDYPRALAEYDMAQRGLPNSAEVLISIAAIERRQGKWEQSTKTFEKAESLNPKDVTLLQNLAVNYQALKNFEAAEKTLDRGIQLDPKAFGLRGLRAQLAIYAKGDVAFCQKQIEKVPPGVDPGGVITLSRVYLLGLQRRFPEVLAVLNQTNQQSFDIGGPTSKAFWEAISYSYMHEPDKAREAFERARAIAERAVQESPDDASRHAQLGAALAGLGRKEEAIREGRRAAELLPETKDAFDGPAITIALAQIYTWTGEKDQAIQLLEHSLSTPAGISIPLLKLDPVWDPLRGDPRFEALLSRKI